MKRVPVILAIFLLIHIIVPAALGLGFQDESLLTPTGIVGKPYSHRLNGRAGSPPYHFKIDSGTLPPGVTLSTNGLISGIPTASGNYKIWANLGDSWNKHSERQISITIFDAQPPKASTALEKPGWKLLWNDEFDRAALDRDRWKDVGEAPTNAISRDGVLHLRIASAQGGTNRVSTIETRGAKSFALQYGRFEMRARPPRGSGLLAALSLLPVNADYRKLKSDGGTRAAPGEATEIAILEQLGRETNAVHYEVHFGKSPVEGRQTEHRRLQLPFSPQDDFHVYALEWNDKSLVWYLDGLELYRSDKRPHAPFFLRASLYEGASKWRGEVDTAVPYPKDFEIDYVRVYGKEK